MTSGGRIVSGYRLLPHEWIELADGCRLSARLWLPDAADTRPVGAVLEYLPYRKDDRTARQDSTRHPYFAERGLASVRVDIRGTGDSEGLLLGEYLPAEQDDCLEVISWIARQPWCNGSVGMIGYSWGGFNGLQVAARKPPELKAVVSLYSTDDRYADDCHYLGGAVLANDMLRWAQTMRAIDALPPDPAIVGERWREMWRERLEGTPHFVVDWLAHQRRDEFWEQGSVNEDYAAIEAPTLVVGGWADAYTNAVPRLVERLTCPRAGIIGPWAHVFPERGVPGPAIGFLQECVGWFDHWLNGVDNGAEDRPLLQVWLQDPVASTPSYEDRPGRWIAFDSRPPAEAEALILTLAGDGELLTSSDAAPSSSDPVELRTLQTLGSAAGVWCANGLPDELPRDQRSDDALSVCFDTTPLEARTELLGSPVLEVDVAADRPVAHLVARLCDVAPDGSSALLSYGVLNLAHRDGHNTPRPLRSGERYRVTVPLNVLGQAVAEGHRLRLALSTTWWPMVWPAAEEATVTVWPGSARLSLPRVSGEGVAPRPFGPPEYAAPLPTTAEPIVTRTLATRTEGTAGVLIEETQLHELTLAESGTRIREADRGWWRIRNGDPTSAHSRFEREYLIERAEWRALVRADAEMYSDAERYRVDERLAVFEGEECFFETEQSYDIPRDLT